MTSRRFRLAMAAALLFTTPAWGQSTVTYTYDSLGRLVNSTYSAGPYQAYSYDAADNRTGFTMSTTPPGPVAVTDNVTASGTWNSSCSSPCGTGVKPTITFNPRTNDSSPLGYGLTITGVTQGGNGTVTYTGTSVTYTYNFFELNTMSDSDSFTYTISDGHGGTATATVNVDVEVTGTCQGIPCSD